MTHPEGWSAADLERARKLAARAAEQSSKLPFFAVRAPGRVNLIGEHTDYSGLPVLPVAIDRSTIIVAAVRNDREIHLFNRDPAYESRRYRIETRIEPYQSGDWANYHKAAVQGVIDHFSSRGAGVDGLKGATMFLDGNVPPAAGLSSSSALTVASAIAFMAVNDLHLSALETAAMAARSERYVGTRGGGMDQAVSMLGVKDHALFINFDPLRVETIRMPDDVSIVVANSHEIADKSGQVRDEYNLRVIECAVAARLLAQSLKLENVRILGDVVSAIPDYDTEFLLNKLCESAPQRIADFDAAAGLLETSSDALATDLFGADASRIRVPAGRKLEIYKRARHVLSENRRVQSAVDALRAGDLDSLGALMNQSHSSLEQDFEVSTTRLNDLVECARKAGALGARLTGAGFGGCIVALCRSQDSKPLLSALERDYYAKMPHAAGVDHSPSFNAAEFKAGPGASTMVLNF
jgi:N-acetylgalactosamine kinase